MISVNDFAKLTTDLQEVFNEASANKIADAMGLNIFNVGETERLDFKHVVLHGVKGIEEVAEGQNLPAVTGEEGDDITWSQRYFGALPTVTKKMRKFELTDQIEDVVRSITDDAWDKIDQSLADDLLYGWDTTHTDVYGKLVSSVGPDGLALFSALHTYGGTSQTYSNIISDGTNLNASLSRAALVELIKDGRTYRDANNIIRPIRIDTIIVPPSLEDLAHRIIDSVQISGSANWDPNDLVRNRFKGNVKVWERLEQTGQGTSKSAHWFAYDSKMVGKSLQCKFSERPSLDAPDQVYENKNWQYSIDYFYTHGIGFAPYIRGSKGTNAA